MSYNKKTRRLGYLINKCYAYHISEELTLIEYLNDRIQGCADFKSKDVKFFREIKNLVLELKIDKKEYFKICYNNKNHPKFDVNLNTIKEKRDNKGVYIGNGGSNRSSVRYPKKNRSKKVWKIFYEMFPYRAKMDDYWKGKSKRMN